ncbi:MAG TPA: GAF domain-containing protein [Anaerolineales bacterium]|nr:GAF domain-containing protein [Anaerolineales bacterium]
MDKIPPRKNEHDKQFDDIIKNRIKGLFSDREGFPTHLSNHEVEALQARVAELEAKLADTEPPAVQSEAAPAVETPPGPLPAVQSVEVGSLNPEKPRAPETRSKSIGGWTAGLFALLGLAFFLFDIKTVFIDQGGRFDLSDRVLMPVSALMFLVALLSLLLMRRNRFSLGGSLLFYFYVLVPPIVAVLLLQGIVVIAVVYIALLGGILIGWVLPASSRMRQIAITAFAVAVCLGIEYWNPGFRIATALGDFAAWATVLAVVALLAVIVRQFPNLSLRPKVIMALVGITALTVGVVSYYLLSRIYQNSYDAASAQVTTENQQHILSIQTFLSQHSQDVMILSRLPDLRTLITAEQTGADPAVIASDTANFKQDLQAFFDAHPVYDNVRFIDASGHEVAKVTASYISTALQNKATRPFFAIPAKMPAGSLYLSPLELEQDMGKIIVPNVPVVRFATPVYTGNELAGVVVANVVAKNFLSVLDDPNHHVMLVDQKGFFLYDNREPGKLFGGATDLNTGYTLAQTMPAQSAALLSGKAGSLIDQQNIYYYAPITVLNGTTPSWFLLYEVPQSEIYGSANRTLAASLLILGAILLVALGIAVYLGNTFTAPLISLTHTAQAAAQGDFSVQSKLKSRDEIGVLAQTFNSMTVQLGNLIGTLEQRVAARTHDLELASEVGRTITEKVADLGEMLTSAVEMIRSSFNLYYAQVYLLDPTGRTISLRAGTGETGKQLLLKGHRLIVGPGSLNGRAVAEKKPIIVADTTRSENFLPNPLLPNTRSEMVIPLLAGEKLLGVLDLQSEQVGLLNADNLPVFETLAGQLAIALQNATLFAAAAEARSEVEAQIRRLTERGWQEFLDAIERGQKVGFAFDQQGVVPLKEEALAPIGAESALSVPITVTGAQIGTIQVANGPDQVLTKSQTELVQVTASQLAQHIENLRLLNQAEQYRDQADRAARRLTREGWDTFVQEHGRETSGFAFDLTEVRPLNGNGSDRADGLLKHPLVVRSEAIGELSAHVESDSAEAAEIITAVAEQLSGHIEALRLLETTQSSESKLAEALDIAKLANWEYDVERDRFLFNDHFYSIFHTSAEQMGGYEVSSADYARRLVHPDDVPMVGAAIEKALASTDKHYSTQLEHRVIYADGGTGYLSVEVHIDRDEQGKILRYYGANQDITERKLAEQAVAKRAAELQTVAEVSTTTAKALEPDRLLQTVVDVTKERFGVYHAHVYLLDESWNTLLLAAGAGEVGRQMVATGHAIPVDTEKSLVARSVRERQAVIVDDVHADPGFLPNPLLPETHSEMALPMMVGERVLGVFDVQSDRREGFSKEDANIFTTLAAQVAVALQNARLYAEQAAAVTQLRELDRLKSSFLANMSHELRTPLNSILGFSDVIIEEVDGPLTDTMRNDLGLIQKNGQHLLHLINDVLDMAKIEAGSMNLNVEKLRLHEILEEVNSITSTLASEKNLALFIENDSDREVEITGDRTRLRQVMINIVNNAIKFTEKGKISLRVTRPEDQKVLIAVRDTGIGIAPDKLEAIFQEFTQVDTSSTRKAGGTGLGLPISRRLVEMHGGRLWAESSGVEGEGSAFFVELPLEAQPPASVEKTTL